MEDLNTDSASVDTSESCLSEDSSMVKNFVLGCEERGGTSGEKIDSQARVLSGPCDTMRSDKLVFPDNEPWSLVHA